MEEFNKSAVYVFNKELKDNEISDLLAGPALRETIGGLGFPVSAYQKKGGF